MEKTKQPFSITRSPWGVTKIEHIYFVLLWTMQTLPESRVLWNKVISKMFYRNFFLFVKPCKYRKVKNVSRLIVVPTVGFGFLLRFVFDLSNSFTVYIYCHLLKFELMWYVMISSLCLISDTYVVGHQIQKKLATQFSITICLTYYL